MLNQDETGLRREGRRRWRPGSIRAVFLMAVKLVLHFRHQRLGIYPINARTPRVVPTNYGATNRYDYT
jgi:hypothetical protein